MFKDMTVYGFNVSAEAQVDAWRKWEASKGHRALGKLASPIDEPHVISRVGDRMLSNAKKLGIASFEGGKWVKHKEQKDG